LRCSIDFSSLNGWLYKMQQKTSKSRRAFMLQVASAAGAVPLASADAANTGLSTATPLAQAAIPEPYQSLSPDEATFIEALVNVMCPADEYSPNGVDCGLATYIDRQLSGPYGKGDGRYNRGPFRSGKPELGMQLPLTPEQFCKTGIAAANAVCMTDHGRSFALLEVPVADDFLKAVHLGRVQHPEVSLALWFNEVIYKLFVEACFADPMYGGNRNVVFWKMIGYPGLPATHTLDMVRYRGKPYPGAKDPKSIIDFT
jgi:gluconate 2-dehydrogenase gamma chain